MRRRFAPPGLSAFAFSASVVLTLRDADDRAAARGVGAVGAGDGHGVLPTRAAARALGAEADEDGAEDVEVGRGVAVACAVRWLVARDARDGAVARPPA